MIASLSGKLLFRSLDKAIVDVGGVGYEVFLSTDGLSRLGEISDEVFLFIHTHVREDAIILYGFHDEDEKEMFLVLKTVSGIGPKLALSILSGLTVGDLCIAIQTKDIKTLTSLQGVGKKTAERLCVDLKEKVGHLGVETTDRISQIAPVQTAGSVAADVLSALVNLGYPDPVARQALASVKKDVGEQRFAELNLEELLKEGLRTLA